MNKNSLGCVWIFCVFVAVKRSPAPQYVPYRPRHVLQGPARGIFGRRFSFLRLRTPCAICRHDRAGWHIAAGHPPGFGCKSCLAPKKSPLLRRRFKKKKEIKGNDLAPESPPLLPAHIGQLYSLPQMVLVLPAPEAWEATNQLVRDSILTHTFLNFTICALPSLLLKRPAAALQRHCTVLQRSGQVSDLLCKYKNKDKC